jgi:hypothetical protein
MDAVSFVPENELMVFVHLSFTEVALANVPRLWLFCLSSFGKFLVRQSKTKCDCHIVSEAHKNLMSILLQRNRDSDFDYSLNALALTLGIGSRENVAVMNHVRAVVLRILQQLISSTDQELGVPMIAVFGQMPECYQIPLFSLFVTLDIRIQRAISACIRELDRNKQLCVLTNDRQVRPEIYGVLHANLMLVHHMVLQTRRPSQGVDAPESSSIGLFVRDVALSLAIVFRHLLVPRPACFFDPRGFHGFPRTATRFLRGI